MKKKLTFLLILLFSAGCTKTDAKFEVESYLNKFQNHEKEVINSLDSVLNTDKLSENQKNQYKIIMKRQYTDLTYKITDEHYNGDEAKIEVIIEVYNYAKSKKKALESLKDVSDENILNKELEMMDKENERIKYTLIFTVQNKEGKWQLQSPNKEMLEKIHGIYEYELDNVL